MTLASYEIAVETRPSEKLVMHQSELSALPAGCPSNFTLVA